MGTVTRLEMQDTAQARMTALLEGASIEVMPRTAAKVEDFGALLPKGSRVYVAHIEGTPIEDMVQTVRRLSDEGYAAMPHVPARIIPDLTAFEDWLKRYADAGACQALVLAGGPTTPLGTLTSAMDLLVSGLFDKHGFKRLHVAGHPEGNKDIDPDGSNAQVDAALAWKQGFAEQTDAKMAIATQFAFESGPIIAWENRLRGQGITLPIHVGVAGPTKLQTLIKFAIACGVGPSLGVLQKRAKDITKLMRPIEPTDLVQSLADHKAQTPDSLIETAHVFPLGGIKASAEWLSANR
ncbi:5,10-methylenetetrahydrofolate reductase [Pseudoprimorskyibacter insulae]|uniref:Methylenetetrahydrofolate reductase (NAD(P)H) n=1 Tax=Pseudoprimorskyibacter insulae TaxID=1695997 RepID=A0A2R8AW11_9RHOB|nr:5,10-methylenetetrahydrofolate reductase [Pseudoprimorskyibacter insulae]SPF80213.1 hypothetical protein PRI8871_02019 [Pseudoprimorskyibacter insulae]